MKYTCEFCNKVFEYNRVCHFNNHVAHCYSNPNRKVKKGRKWSEEGKKKLSEKRKKFLLENPDKHPWKNNNKFTSKPCEEFKCFLKSKGYKFEEEVNVVPNRNYSVDICFPELMLVFEINGNQHYNLATMELLPYYQERHNIIESFGWQVIEIPYNQSYNEKFRMGLCRQLDAKLTSNQYLCRFESCQPYLQSLKNKTNKKKKKENKSNKLSEDIYLQRKEQIINSGIDITKYGWITKVVKATGLTKRQVEKCVKHFQSDFELCYKLKKQK